jgi:hypothetical protein
MIAMAVHSHRIHVLDGADDHHVVTPVAHDLQLEFLPTQHGPLDQRGSDRRQGQATSDQFLVLFDVVGDTSAGATERKGGTADGRVADILDERQCLVIR